LKRSIVTVAILLALAPVATRVHAQAPEGVLSEGEVESLRDASYIPTDRIAAYVKILNNREQRINELMSRKLHPGFAQDMHDVLDQFGAISDELNDNLNEFDTKHRDVRKSLPKLVSEVERWSTALRTVPDDEQYRVVRKIALDSLKDMHDAATEMESTQQAYFIAHPDAEKAEKARNSNPHAPSE
jgi:archaellum component FlaC